MSRHIVLSFVCGVGLCLTTMLQGGTVAAQGAGTGTIEGVVRLMGPAPPNAIIRMGADPRCSKIYAGKRITQEIVVVDANGGLANGFVALQGTFPGASAPAVSVTIDQQGCVYHPHVLGAMVGQTLEIKNSDPTLHNVHSLSTHGNSFNV